MNFSYTGDSANNISNNGQSSTAPNHQSTLDEITNKVFNELLQRKVDAHAHGLMMPKTSTVNQMISSESIVLQQSERNQSLHPNQSQQHNLLSQQQQNTITSSLLQIQPKRLSDAEDGGGRSDDWCSETSSSNVGQLRQPIAKGRAFVAANRHRKYTITPSAPSMPILPSGVNVVTDNGPIKLTLDGSSIADESSKKPLIAVWKAGVNLQNAAAPITAQAENNGSYSEIASNSLWRIN